MSGLKIKYSELFSLSIQQPFYENGICKSAVSDLQPDLILIPTEECQRSMKRLDLVFRPVARQAGGIVLANTTINSTSDTIMRFPAREGDKLSFWMVLKNSEFLNFNDLPVASDAGKIWYFNNEVADAGAPRNALHLNVNPTGVDGASDLVKISTANYNFHHSSTVMPHSAFVKHLLTGAMMPAKSIINQSGQADLSFDLSSLPSGKCKLIIGGADTDFFYYQGLSKPSSTFGVIEIILAPSIDPNYRTIELDDVLTPARPLYTILFNNRKTRWRYRIELEKNSPIYIAMQGLSPVERTVFIDHFRIISDNDASITFSQSLIGDRVFEFISDSVIALKEKYISSVTSEGLHLVLKKNEGILGEAMVRDYLPFPSNSLINALNAPTIYSDIFLTI